MIYQILDIIWGLIANKIDKEYVVIQREREPSLQFLLIFAFQLQQYQTLKSQ